MSAPSKMELEQAIAPLMPGFQADGLRVEEALFLQTLRAKGINIKIVRVVLIDDQ